MTSNQENSLSVKTRVLRRMPGLSRYYEAIASLDAERISTIASLNASRDVHRSAYEQVAQERDAALTLAHAHEAERDAQRRAYEQAAQERDAALTLAHAHETERDAQGRAYEQAAQERDAALVREDALLTRLGAKLDLASATILGLGARQEEAMARFRRGLLGTASSIGQSMTVDLYLDLLEASLTGLLMEDGSQAPWTKESFDPNLRSVGRDWPTSALTMIGTARMRNLRMLTLRALDENVPGDFIETGVWRGGACIYMKGILAARGEQGRRIFVADSFKGLPPPDEASYPADAGDQHHTVKALAVSRDAVEASFRRYGLLDEGVILLEGWFKDTLPAAPIERLAVLRLDGDMYESTMDALKALYHKVSPGGFVIIDDYILPACARAVEDFRAEWAIRAPMETVDGSAVWWQVSR
jgi:hypothetical protein